MRRVGALAGLLLLAGCGGGSEEEASTGNADEPKIRIANEHHDKLAALSPGRQRLAMLRAIRQSGMTCQVVDNTGYQEEYRNMRMWVATCGEDSKSYAIFIAPNADVQVRDCAEAGTLSLPRCQGLPPAQPDDSLPKFEEGAADKAFRNEF